MNQPFRILLLLLTFLTFVSIRSQELLDEYTIQLEKSSTKAPFSVIDLNNNSYLFFVQASNITSIKYDSKNKLKSVGKFSRPPSAFNEIIGYSLDNENGINLYFANKKKNKFFLKTLKSDGTSEEKEFDFKIKKEHFLQVVNYQNTFYVLTAPKMSSTLKIYKFDGATYTVVNHDFSSERFYDSNNKPIQLSYLFGDRDIEIIEDDVPSAIEITSSIFKIYPKGNEILITLDHRDNATRLIRLNLDDNSFSIDYHEIPTTAYKKLDYLKSNSFIYKDKIYQLVASRDLMIFTIKEEATKKLIKKYTATKDDPEITFKNTAIYQDGSLYSSGIRELVKTRQFLRKITNSSVGIVAYEKEDLLQLSLGGIKEMNTGSGLPMMIPGGIPIVAAGAFTMSINPALYAFNSYSKTRSVYIKCLFDINTIEHMPGPVASNVFDDINEFADSLDRFSLETVFKKDDYFIYGFYHSKEKKYSLFRFEK